jgi:hypothetical protein
MHAGFQALFALRAMSTAVATLPGIPRHPYGHAFPSGSDVL